MNDRPTPVTVEHCAAFIHLINTLEPGYLPPLPTVEATMARAAIWHGVLEGIPTGWLNDSIRTYYSRGYSRLMPGTLRAEWDRLQRQRQEREDQFGRPDRDGRTVEQILGQRAGQGYDEYGRRGMPPWFRPLRDHLAEHPDTDEQAWVEQWCREHGEPEPWWDAPVDATERRCRHWRLCQCNHTECRDGWLDEEQPVVRDGKVREGYMGVVRCAACESAALEAASRNVR